MRMCESASGFLTSGRPFYLYLGIVWGWSVSRAVGVKGPSPGASWPVTARFLLAPGASPFATVSPLPADVKSRAERTLFPAGR
jgi:hypothetical protein